MLALGGSLIWYGVFMNRISARDWEFVKRHPSARFFPVVSYWWGNQVYYDNMDAAAAAANYWEAISRYSLFMDAWLDLAKVELSRGNEAEARRIVSLTAPRLAQTSYWKWKELLLAFDLDNETDFSSVFNFILTSLPYRVQEACDLALRYWGSWSGIASHISSENGAVFMRVLMRAGVVDEVLSFWEVMKAGQESIDKRLMLDTCEFALNNGYVSKAKGIWNAWGGGPLGVYDGGFELQPTNDGFGWRIAKHAQVDVGRTRIEQRNGKYSLHIHFLGTANVSFYNVSQIVPVKPGGTYSLSFARKSQDITTDQGVFLQVSSYKCEMPLIKSRPMIGTNPWEIEKLEIAVPDSCEALLLQVCRSESLKVDNRISGDYWLDEVQLHEETHNGQ